MLWYNQEIPLSRKDMRHLSGNKINSMKLKGSTIDSLLKKKLKKQPRRREKQMRKKRQPWKQLKILLRQE